MSRVMRNCIYNLEILSHKTISQVQKINEIRAHHFTEYQMTTTSEIMELKSVKVCGFRLTNAVL